MSALVIEPRVRDLHAYGSHVPPRFQHTPNVMSLSRPEVPVGLARP
jgi:hypothetical protein